MKIDSGDVPADRPENQLLKFRIMKERNQIILKLLLTHILLPLGLVSATLLVKTDRFLMVSVSQIAVIILFLAGYWEFFTSRFKWIFFTGIETLLLFTVGERIYSNHNVPDTLMLNLILVVVLLYVVYILCNILRVIFKNDPAGLEIEFPFKDGKYMITDGGNSKISRIMNYHFHSPVHKKRNTNNSMLYATDIVRLSAGNHGFLPAANNDYSVFGEKLYSPMGGIIVKVINNLEDNIPYSGDYPYNTGNTIVIKNENYYLLLGHLMKGSIVVAQGDTIPAGEYVGKAGNSGMSERPHLHMQLMESADGDYWKGTGICIRYDNKNLFKNRLIQR